MKIAHFCKDSNSVLSNLKWKKEYILVYRNFRDLIPLVEVLQSEDAVTPLCFQVIFFLVLLCFYYLSYRKNISNVFDAQEERERERESIQRTYDISSNSVVLLNTLIHTHTRTHADNCQPGYQLEFLLLHNKTSQTDWCRLGGFTEEQGRDENNERMIASLSVFACILIFHLYLEYANTLFMSFCLKTWITLHSMGKKTNTLARF